MNNVVRLFTARDVVGSDGNQYPAPTYFEEIESEIREVYKLSGELHAAAEHRPALLSAYDRLQPLNGPYGAHLRREIEDILAPATKDEVNKHLILLLDSNPRAQRLTDTFGELVLSDVGALRPSRGAVEAACRYLRVTPRPEFKPVPDIPEIIEIIKSKQNYFRGVLALLDGLQVRLAKADELIRASDPAAIEKRRARIRELLSLEKMTEVERSELGAFPYLLVDDVRTEIRRGRKQFGFLASSR